MFISLLLDKETNQRKRVKGTPLKTPLLPNALDRSVRDKHSSKNERPWVKYDDPRAVFIFVAGGGKLKMMSLSRGMKFVWVI